MPSLHPSLSPNQSTSPFPTTFRAFCIKDSIAEAPHCLRKLSATNGGDGRRLSSTSFLNSTQLWNTKMEHHLLKNDFGTCSSLYPQMLEEKIDLDACTFAQAFQACSSLKDINALRLLHNDILRLGLNSDPSVAYGLMLGYFECGRSDLAFQLLDEMSADDVVTWTVIIRESLRKGRRDMAIWIIRRMIALKVWPDEVALITMLSVISDSGCVSHGEEVHGYLIRRGLQTNRKLMGSLVNMYSRLGKLALCERIVDRTASTVVVWTTMIDGCVHTGDAAGAAAIFARMMNLGIQPTGKTITCALRAASFLGSLKLGDQIHGQAIKRGLKGDKFVMSSILDMYTNCGVSTQISRRLFDEMGVRDVVSWTALISAYGRMGEGSSAVRAFSDMMKVGLRPDSVTFTSLLSGCSASGMLHQGLRCFEMMIREHGIKPREEHYACLMDLVAKEGRLAEAYEIIQSLELANDARVWEVFLSACKAHGNVGLGEMAARRLLEIEPESQRLCFHLLSDIYSASGRWQDADNLRRLLKMRGKRLQKL